MPKAGGHEKSSLIMTDWMFRWLNPTILLMYPILLILYYKLARREEQQVLKEYGDAYLKYGETDFNHQVKGG
ncbi:MAG: hypothetical protein KJP06_01025 [Deltaproteobacteria bacterium]|nr:hypothetical protein [Deltaproteobacteria bacterium]